MIRRVVGRALPVGSLRRSRVVRVARAVGFFGEGTASSYQRWIATIEPRLFSPLPRCDGASQRGIRFVIEVQLDSATTAEVERTFISLSNQTYPHWSAHVVGAPQSPKVAACVSRLRSAESRITDGEAKHATTSPGTPPVAPYMLRLRAGDMLAPHALTECAVAATNGVRLITADDDDLTQFGDQRTTPRHHVGQDIDALHQFDPLAGLVVAHESLWSSDQGCASDALPLAFSLTGEHAHIGLVLLHKRHCPGPIQRVPPATPIDTVSASLGTRALVHIGAPQMGTQVRYRDFGLTPIIVAVFITSPLDSETALLQRAELREQIDRAKVMVSSLGAPLSFVLADRTFPEFACASSVAEELDRLDAGVAFLIDGSLRIRSADLFVDLVGLALRADVFAVAPVIVSPSGIAIDAGLIDTGSLVARCGLLRRPPYDLLWCRGVDALSGRCVVAKAAELRRLGDRPVSANGFREAVREGRVRSGKLLIWPHHQVEVTYGLRSGGDMAPVLAWREHRVMTWFGSDIAPYSPLNDSKAESFW